MMLVILSLIRMDNLDITTNSSTTRDDFIEHEYSAKDLADFNAFQIKIRMRGTDSTNPPIIKRLRVVATG